MLEGQYTNPHVPNAKSSASMNTKTKRRTQTAFAPCLTWNNRVLLEGFGKSKILQTGSNSHQNNSEWGVKMFFIGIIAAFFIIIGIGYPLCAAIIYPIYRALGGKQSFFDYMKDV